MKAVVFRRYGPPGVLRIEDVPKPAPSDDEVLIRVRAATVSTADGEVRAFRFPLWIRLPLRLLFGVFRPRARTRILGQELAGDVCEVGKNVTRFRKGDAVFAPVNGFGAHAEYICVNAEGAIAIKPSNVSYEDAACFTVFALNAFHFVKKASIEAGEKVLINGAGGGIGTIAVQLAKNLGAEVTAVDRTEKLGMLREIGADHVIDYTQERFTDNGRTYDVILDVHGKSPYAASLRSLGDGGRYVLANPVLSSMLRAPWTSRTSGKKVLFEFATYRRENLESLRGLLETGAIRAVIDRRYRLDQIVEAHRYVDSGQKVGNVVLTIGDRSI